MTSTTDFMNDAIRAINDGQFENAIAELGKILAVDADNIQAYRLLSICSGRLNKPQESALWISKAATLSPNDPALQMELGQALQTAGMVAEAADSYRRSVLLSPGDGLARELYTQTLLEEWLLATTGRKVGREASKTYAQKMQSGFFRTYLGGPNVLDVGYRGGFGDAVPIVAHATGVDFGTPGYDGVNLPFADGSQDAVYSSHCLEHVEDLPAVIREWFRVLKVGGYLVSSVPHQYLYEKRRNLPSQRNGGHLHFFTPAKLMSMFEEILPPNHYRVRHLADNDFLYDYSLPTTTHPVGCYEIEIVLEKIAAPAWDLE